MWMAWLGKDGYRSLDVHDSHFVNAKRMFQAVFTARNATGAAYCVLVKPGAGLSRGIVR